VFHDEGNVNYSVICPTGTFDRDKHAKMVVRALHRLGADQAMVNERHDIVLPSNVPTLGDTAEKKPLKISGSAYKLTRLRSLHHGTCLLSSPNIKSISQYLRSPAKPFIKARGVDSVSSPITNVNVSNDDFEEAVVAEFGEMYMPQNPVIVGDASRDTPEIAKGLQELMSREWTYLQTPQFTFASHPTEDDPRVRPALPEYLPANFRASFTARNGAVTNAKLEYKTSEAITGRLEEDLEGRNLHEILDWLDVFGESQSAETQAVSTWLNSLFGQELYE